VACKGIESVRRWEFDDGSYRSGRNAENRETWWIMFERGEGRYKALQVEMHEQRPDREERTKRQRTLIKQTLEGHGGFINSVAFLHDSKLLASASPIAGQVELIRYAFYLPLLS
jgi:hypothetical protein